jgi:hypothetical protein
MIVLDATPLRPDSADFPLFLHVLGAMVLVGAMLATTVLAWAGGGRPAVSRAAFWTLLTVVIPAWIVMRVDAQWVYSREGYNGENDPGWLGLGFGIADVGVIFILVTTGFAFWWSRRGATWQGRVVGVLSSVYLALLAVAWWAMSGKP